MWYATHNKSFGLGLTAINEARKRKYYIIDDLFVLFYWSLNNVVLNDI